MTLEQQLIREPVEESPEQELIKKIIGQNVVVKIEKENPHLKELIREYNPAVKVCHDKKNIQGAYDRAITYALTREATKLIIINNNHTQEKWIKNRITKAINCTIIKQLKEYYEKSLKVSIINLPNY